MYNRSLGGSGRRDLSLLYRYDSPLTYSLSSGSVPLTSIQGRSRRYASLPNNQTLFYAERGSEVRLANLWDLGLQ